MGSFAKPISMVEIATNQNCRCDGCETVLIGSIIHMMFYFIQPCATNIAKTERVIAARVAMDKTTAVNAINQMMAEMIGEREGSRAH